MITKTILIISIFAAGLFGRCGNQDEFYTVEMVDGVRTVHNIKPLWGDEPRVALEFVQKIGDLDAVDENYAFFRPQDLARDINGNLYILDQGNSRIQKFDPNGRYLSTIGKRGEGPGELQRPNTIEMDSNNNLLIGEGGRRQINVLSNSGEELNRIQVPGAFDYFRLMKNGTIVMPTPPAIVRETGELIKQFLVYQLDSNGNVLREFSKQYQYPDKEVTYWGNIFSLCLGPDDSIYLTFHNQNRIEKYSPEGVQLFSVTRKLDFEPSYKMETRIMSSGRFQQKLNIPKFNLISMAMDIDDHERIWMKTYKKQKEENDTFDEYLEFEIFDTEGVLLTKIPVPVFFGYMRIFQDRIYLIDRDEEMAVYEYKIIEK